MKTARQFYPTKAAWATAKVHALRLEAEAIRSQSLPSADRMAIRRKMVALAAISRDIAKYQRLAERFASEAA